ncbi:MAG: DUF4139 domain-containing protein [Flavobacteriales bacterium]|nr:DUF4139 domain-containing protein [Flavobacteriales bacterium]
MCSFRSTLLFCLLPLTALAGEELPVTSTIQEVKVFLNGAQISRSASKSLPLGASTVVFTGLSQQLDPQSIQVNGKGGFTILGVEHRVNYLSESPNKAEVEDLQKRLKALEHDRNAEVGTQQVWQNEEQLLLKNWAVGGQDNGVSATQLQGVNDYVRTRMTAVKKGLLDQQEKITAIDEELNKLRQQLQQLQAQAARPTSEVVVELSAPAAVQARFTLGYFVHNAGWTPAYDLRATSVDKPIELLMKARLVNNTGEDWDKVDIALSSGNPTLGGTMPNLRPWVLEQPIVLQTLSLESMRRDRANKAMAPAAAGSADMEMAYEDEPAITEVGQAVVYRTTTTEYTLDVPFSVPSDGRPHTVGVRTHIVPATYTHYCTPKLDRDAFLYARTTGWEDLALLPGDANVFFEGTYVGRTHLDLSRPQDTLNISLGRDKNIVVERVKRKGYSEKPVIGGKRTVTIGWDITVRNTGNARVDLILQDQVPISSRSEVEVKLEDEGGATVDKDRGSLTWRIPMDPRTTKELKFTYSVKHPKDQPVVLE